MIKVKNLTKIYKDNNNQNIVFENLNFEIKQGEITIIRGQSGCGKSTLLNILASIDNNANGEVIVDNQNILTLNESQRADFRNKYMGFVFQSHELIPEFNILENITVPLLLRNESQSIAKNKAIALLKKLQIPSTHFYKKPEQLSGGQQQRVAIARAIIHTPKIIFADEPTGNLDPKTRDEVIELIKDLKSDDRTIVIVTHDDVLEEIADTVFKFEYNNGNFEFKRK